MKKAIILSLIIIVFLSCEAPYDIKLSFENKTKKEIFVKYVEAEDDIKDFMNNYDLASWDTYGHFLMPDSFARFPAWYSWEEKIMKLNDRKVHFYIFNADSFYKFRKGLVDKNNLKYKKLDFSTIELNNINWNVVFEDSI